MERIPIESSDPDQFWIHFQDFVKVLGLDGAPFTPALMKAIAMASRYYVLMEAQMEWECATEREYGIKAPRPNPACAFFKTHPHELFDRFWGPPL